MRKGNVMEKHIERTVVLTRTFDAPRAMVWKAWTDPRQLAKWWGPHGFTNPVCRFEAKPGGTIRIDMTGPDGTVYPMPGVVHEVAEPDRLIFTAIAEDEDGTPHLCSHTTAIFETQGGKTKLTVHANAVGFTAASAQMLAGMQEGWSQSLERLSGVVK